MNTFHYFCRLSTTILLFNYSSYTPITYHLSLITQTHSLIHYYFLFTGAFFWADFTFPPPFLPAPQLSQWALAAQPLSIL